MWRRARVNRLAAESTLWNSPESGGFPSLPTDENALPDLRQGPFVAGDSVGAETHEIFRTPWQEIRRLQQLFEDIDCHGEVLRRWEFRLIA